MRVLIAPIPAVLLVFSLAACAERETLRPEGATAPAASQSTGESTGQPQGQPSSPSAGTAPAKVAPPPALEPGAVSDTAAPAAAPAGAAPAPSRARQPSEQDLADCYRYAQATIAHDRRIDRDRGDAGGFGSLGGDVGAFSAQISKVGEASTFDRAYASCMRSKGYDGE